MLCDDHVQYFLYQLLAGVAHLHSASVVHRDLKPSNILVNRNCDLKVCDFGLSRACAGPAARSRALPGCVLSSFELAAAESSAHGSRRLALQSEATAAQAPLRPWSPCRKPFETVARPAAFAHPGPPAKLQDEGPQGSYVTTRWYRAPELLCFNSGYGLAMDMWSIACILGEMLGRVALFPGRDYLDQLRLVIELLELTLHLALHLALALALALTLTLTPTR